MYLDEKINIVVNEHIKKPSRVLNLIS